MQQTGPQVCSWGGWLATMPTERRHVIPYMFRGAWRRYLKPGEQFMESLVYTASG